MNKRGPKVRLKKGSVAVRLLIPAPMNAKIEILAKQELRPKTSMVHILLIEALEHRSKSAG